MSRPGYPRLVVVGVLLGLAATSCGGSTSSTTVITEHDSRSTPTITAAPGTAASRQKQVVGAYVAAMAPVQRQMGAADVGIHAALATMDEAHDGTWRVARDRLFHALAANEAATRSANGVTPPSTLESIHKRELFALGAQNRAINSLLFDVRSNAPTKTSLRLGQTTLTYLAAYRNADCAFQSHIRVIAFQAGVHVGASYWVRLC
jgi:hypothetical protein